MSASPTRAMAGDLHNAYEQAASDEMAANPSGSRIGVALAGDAWITAVNSGIAMRNPYLTAEPAGQVDLWDSDRSPRGLLHHPGWLPRERLWRLFERAGVV